MSTFQNAIAFFVNLGVYDVVLPFLLVFTLVFAILEKTKILGYEDKEKGITKKNLNAMMAFVTGFLVIASTELVRTINTVVANTVLLLLLAFLFMLLTGVFKGDDEFKLGGGWLSFFMVLMFIGIVLIFLGAAGWLEFLWFYLVTNIDGAIVGSFLLIAIVIGAMVWIVRSPSPSKGKDEKD